MRYLTYDEYINIGGELEKTAFERVIIAASAVVDSYTQNRLHNVSELSEAVGACVRDLCEYIYANNSPKPQTVASKSQSAGGTSESETYAIKSNQDVRSDMYGIVYNYLYSECDDNGTPLMYRGAMA